MATATQFADDVSQTEREAVVCSHTFVKGQLVETIVTAVSLVLKGSSNRDACTGRTCLCFNKLFSIATAVYKDKCLVSGCRASI
jgi:hypothetical protein